MNGLKSFVPKKDLLGKVYRAGKPAIERVWVDGKQVNFHKYPATSENAGVLNILVPSTEPLLQAKSLEELELVNVRIDVSNETIGQGQQRNRFQTFNVLVDKLKKKGGNA